VLVETKRELLDETSQAVLFTLQGLVEPAGQAAGAASSMVTLVLSINDKAFYRLEKQRINLIPKQQGGTSASSSPVRRSAEVEAKPKSDTVSALEIPGSPRVQQLTQQQPLVATTVAPVAADAGASVEAVMLLRSELDVKQKTIQKLLDDIEVRNNVGDDLDFVVLKKVHILIVSFFHASTNMGFHISAMMFLDLKHSFIHPSIHSFIQYTRFSLRCCCDDGAGHHGVRRRHPSAER
jgi:hypothetical protein